MERNNEDVRTSGEAKSFEPAAPEQLKEILTMVEEITASCELEKPNEHEEYRQAVIDYGSTLKVTVMRCEGQMAKDICVASIYFDWSSGDKKVTSAVVIEQGENSELQASTHWDVDPNSLSDVMELGASPDLFQEHISQLTRQDYDIMEWGLGFSAYNRQKPMTDNQAKRTADLLRDHIELEKNGLKEGDIGTWVDPETGKEYTVLIYRGERHGWIKHKAMYYLMSPVEPGEGWENKKTDWHDIVVSDTEGQQYVLHGDTGYGWVFRTDVNQTSRLAGDTSEEAIHKLRTPFEEVPQEAMKYYEDYAEGAMGTEHSKEMYGVATRINDLYIQKMKDSSDILPEEFEQELANYCAKVLEELADLPQAEEFRSKRAEAWERRIAGETMAEVIVPLVEYVHGLELPKSTEHNLAQAFGKLCGIESLAKPIGS